MEAKKQQTTYPNRAKRRKIQKLAKCASKEAKKRLDEAILKIWNAKYNVTVNIEDDEEK